MMKQYKCTGCGDDRPCFVETNQGKTNMPSTELEDLKCILDETNQTSYNWRLITVSEDQLKQ